MRILCQSVLGVLVVSALISGGMTRAEAPADAGGFSAGFDLTCFKMYGKNGAGASNADPIPDDYYHDTGFLGEGRYWFGYEMENGLGLRARIFEWESTEAYRNTINTQDFEIFDIEGTLRSDIHEWELLAIGGVRWGSIELSGRDFLEFNPSDFEGAGLTTGGEVRRRLFGDLSILGGIRYSMLFGETTFKPVTPIMIESTFVDILELKLGVEWKREMRFGGAIAASAAWEHQAYGTDTYYPHAIDPETPGDVALSGPVFSISYLR